MGEGHTLPARAKGRIKLKHANLNKERANQVKTWSKGLRDVDNVITTYNRFDTNLSKSFPPGIQIVEGSKKVELFGGGENAVPGPT